jgi:hypothetical protein
MAAAAILRSTEAPSFKHQTPGKHQAPNSKPPLVAGAGFGAWILKFP